MNKLLLPALVCMISNSTALAITPEDEQAIIQQMSAMENCMAQIDLKELETMEQQSEQMRTEINALCSQGKEDQAKILALQFSDEVMNSNTMKSMMHCASMVPGMEAQMQVPDLKSELENQSICELVNQ